jgi:glycogen synthase
MITTEKNISSVKKATKTRFRIGVLTPITKDGGADMLCTAMEAMCSLGFGVSVLAEGDESAQNICFDCAEKFPRVFSMLESLPDNKMKIVSKSDVVVFVTCPEKEELEFVIQSGTIPVLPEGCGLSNFDAQAETGCAFTFEEENLWSLVAALIRASENKRFSWDWKTVQQNLADLKKK